MDRREFLRRAAGASAASAASAVVPGLLAEDLVGGVGARYKVTGGNVVRGELADLGPLASKWVEELGELFRRHREGMDRIREAFDG